MSRGNHTLATEMLLTMGGVEVEYAATVTYHRHNASGDGWNEPLEPAHCELVGITLNFTPTRKIALDDLIVAEFEDGLQEAMIGAWLEDTIAAEEARAEARREVLMTEGL